ncbi:endonuclease [bacterium DOLZORAL124_38_8]|nr:MAG: endonuclease [bacterium DOLZORAL124_38_8]
MKYFVYLVQCADDSLYCGITTDLNRRLSEHNGHGPNPGAKYTATRRPVRVKWWAEFENRSLASKEEYRIKQLTKAQKLQLINE